jgi:peptidyl-prolyl cis-trans isomerase B (cyclophilin B)
VTITLAAAAVCTVNSMAHLVSKKYFDGTTCHRVTTDGIFVLQCGDPTGTGGGGPGYSMPEENLPDAPSGRAVYPRGVVAMAKAQPPHTTGSQFFLVYADSQLPPDYTVLGTMTDGVAVIEAIARKGVDGGFTDGPPAEKVSLDSFALS